MTGPDLKAEKRAAAETAAAMVESGMVVGLGTGSTVAELVPVLGARRLDITCAATSPATEQQATAHGLIVKPFTDIDRLDLAIDGADQVDPAGWLIKGAGGALTRERIVAAAADRFVVMVSSDKPVERLHAPVPLELLAFGLGATLRELPDAVLRQAPPTPDGGVLADYHGEVGDPAVLAALLDAAPGVVGHGLFPPSLVSTVLVARGHEVEMRQIS
ncbi:MAG TPA: ribose 5-phosphate isomerase A [Acidimicrobiales bacterium]|nr:ribose 5-phosphate isomerase A [Acidimicrobiales bacterium]